MDKPLFHPLLYWHTQYCGPLQATCTGSLKRRTTPMRCLSVSIAWMPSSVYHCRHTGDKSQLLLARHGSIYCRPADKYLYVKSEKYVRYYGFYVPLLPLQCSINRKRELLWNPFGRNTEIIHQFSTAYFPYHNKRDAVKAAPLLPIIDYYSGGTNLYPTPQVF